MSTRRSDALRFFDNMTPDIRRRIDGGIEQNRKGNLKLTFKDKEGKPISGVTVEAKQKNHEFRFGANIFMLDEFENEEKNAAYREKFPIFNLATLPFYWNAVEPVEGQHRYAKGSPKLYRRPPIDLCLEYCAERGIEPKCHCLNYEHFKPSWMFGLTVDEHKRKLEKRFRELSERYSKIIPTWEVTNETFNRREPGESSFYFEDDYVEWSFRMADRYFPANRLIINDYFWLEHQQQDVANRDPYYMQIQRLFFNGITHLDSIGLQFHSFFPKDDERRMAGFRYNPEYLFERLDLYAKLGKKMQITEMTLSAFSNSEEDEDVQAELVRQIYSLFFSHANMEAIIYWNLVDGYAAFAPQGDMAAGENKYFGGLVRFDMTEKPSYKMLKHLINEEWHTETTAISDENGVATVRGFYGDYELVAHYDGKEIPFSYLISEQKRNLKTITL